MAWLRSAHAGSAGGSCTDDVAIFFTTHCDCLTRTKNSGAARSRSGYRRRPACEFWRRLAASAECWGEDATQLAAEDGCGTSSRSATVPVAAATHSPRRWQFPGTFSGSQPLRAGRPRSEGERAPGQPRISADFPCASKPSSSANFFTADSAFFSDPRSYSTTLVRRWN